jgi:hypothetical protein
MLDQYITIVDNYFDDPLAIRNVALRQSYVEPLSRDGKPIGGRLARHADCPKDIADLAFSAVAKYIPPDKKISSAHIQFRYTLGTTVKKVCCHADSSDYAGIVYLTLPEQCKGGTSFFKHNPTQHIFMNQTRRGEYDFKDVSQWELIKRVDMAFNRLVLYPGKIFHAITPIFFGDNICNARLTQNLFIYTL